MKLHNPFVASEESQSVFLISSILILVCLTLIAFVSVLAMYPKIAVPIVAGIAAGRVVYAMINGR